MIQKIKGRGYFQIYSDEDSSSLMGKRNTLFDDQLQSDLQYRNSPCPQLPTKYALQIPSISDQEENLLQNEYQIQSPTNTSNLFHRVVSYKYRHCYSPQNPSEFVFFDQNTSISDKEMHSALENFNPSGFEDHIASSSVSFTSSCENGIITSKDIQKLCCMFNSDGQCRMTSDFKNESKDIVDESQEQFTISKQQEKDSQHSQENIINDEEIKCDLADIDEIDQNPLKIKIYLQNQYIIEDSKKTEQCLQKGQCLQKEQKEEKMDVEIKETIIPQEIIPQKIIQQESVPQKIILQETKEPLKEQILVLSAIQNQETKTSIEIDQISSFLDKDIISEPHFISKQVKKPKRKYKKRNKKPNKKPKKIKIEKTSEQLQVEQLINCSFDDKQNHDPTEQEQIKAPPVQYEYKCDEEGCARSFKSLRGMKFHKIRIHQKPKKTVIKSENQNFQRKYKEVYSDHTRMNPKLLVEVKQNMMSFNEQNNQINEAL